VSVVLEDLVFNANCNNDSAISLRQLFLVEESREPKDNQLPTASVCFPFQI
jgi:hypothetical protein